MSRPNWLRALRRHLRENPPESGTVSHVEIRHDRGCSRLRGTGPCDCEPEIETGERVDRKHGGRS